MTSRRGFFGLLAGGAVAGPSAIRKAIKELGAKGATSAFEKVEMVTPFGVTGLRDEWGQPASLSIAEIRRNAAYRKVEQMREDLLGEYNVTNRIPSRIASKRSWSPAFKQSEAMKELTAMRELRERLRGDGDDDFVDKVLAALGVE